MPDSEIGLIRISSGDKALIASGSFLTFGSDETKLEIEFEGDRMTMFLEFVDDPEIKPGRIKANVIDQATVRFQLINMNSTLGSQTTEPMELGTLADRTIWMRLRVVGQGPQKPQKSRFVAYSFYVGPKVANAAP